MIQVLPGNEKTWSIDPVHIMPHSESESEDQEHGFKGQKSLPKAVSDVSQFLIQARNASNKIVSFTCTSDYHN